MTANDRQVGGSHYAAGYQHWDLVAEVELGYFEGQITKYVARHAKKHGKPDLEKALHFSEKYAEVLDMKARPYVFRKPTFGQVEERLHRFFAANPHLGEDERTIIALLTHAHDEAQVTEVQGLIRKLIGAHS